MASVRRKLKPKPKAPSETDLTPDKVWTRSEVAAICKDRKQYAHFRGSILNAEREGRIIEG